MTSVLAVSTAVVTSIVAAGASITAALITAILGQRIKRRNDERLEQLKTELTETQAERDAYRDYKYDAIKRLYGDLQPLLFQLSELCSSAYLHSRGLARTARSGNLGAGPESWLNDEYYRVSTVYRLLMPVAVVHLIQRRLTFVDLSVDEGVREQYRFARALAATWNSGFDIAAKPPPIPYRPHDPDASKRLVDEPAVYGLQHLYAGQVDLIVECLVVRDPDGQQRHRTYGEFEQDYKSGAARQALEPAEQLFASFHPRTHPVLWRMIVIQAHLHHAIASTFAGDVGIVVAPTTVLTEEEQRAFDWRQPGDPESEEDAVGTPFAAAVAYLNDFLGAGSSPGGRAEGS